MSNTFWEMVNALVGKQRPVDKPPLSIKPYIDLVKEIRTLGNSKLDRTNVGTYSVFGRFLSFDLEEGIPILTRRKLPLKSTIGELLWFISGNNNSNELEEHFNCSFWREWKANDGTIGPMYGYQWRNSNGVDQFKNLIDNLINDPFSRRHLIDCWVPELLPNIELSPSENAQNGNMALAPCHFAYQLNVTDRSDGNFDVSLLFHQRSSDVMMGLPINIISYYLLLEIICKICTIRNGFVNYIPKSVSCSLGDAHIYKNHLTQADELLKREDFISPVFTCPGSVVSLYDKDISIEKLKQIQSDIFNGFSSYYAHDNLKLVRNV